MIQLIWNSLRFYWRTNLAVLAGIAVAVGVLAGALMTGESVRRSLLELAVGRLGKTDVVVTGIQPFRENLAQEIGGVPMVAIEAIGQHQSSGRRAAKVQVYGVDARFWKFHGWSGDAPSARQVFLSEALATELNAKDGESILLRVEKPSEIPQETLHGKREESSRSMRFTYKGTAPEFALRPQQGAILAAYVPLTRLQQELDVADKANTVLISGGANANEAVKSKFALEDLGLRLRQLDSCKCQQLENGAGLLSDDQVRLAVAAAAKLGLKGVPMLTYLVNFTTNGSKQFPYSLISAIDLPAFANAKPGRTPVILTDWAARDLNAKIGGVIQMESFVWKQEGKLGTENTEAEVTGIVPLIGGPGDRNMAPDYPGISDSDDISEWNPPFPMDLNKVRPVDEDFWHKYKATPKMFVPLAAGQKWWGSRHGKVSGIRIYPADPRFESAFRESIDPATMGISVSKIRKDTLAASAGSTDFGEYFAYFSAFLMFSALILAGLFFKLGVEQRLKEIGLLRSLGFSMGKIRILLLGEGAVLAGLGAIAGMALAVLFAAFILFGLRTWWIGAVGTKALALHITPESLIGGAIGGLLASLFALLLSLRKLPAATPKGLLGGHVDSVTPKRPTLLVVLAAGFGATALALLGATAAGRIPNSTAFFGGGLCTLISLLICFRLWLGSAKQAPVSGQGVSALARLGMRNASERPVRSVLSVALIASATFLLVSVDSFRHSPHSAKLEKASGNGGYPLLAESQTPVYHNLDLKEARSELNLPEATLSLWRITSFRLKSGEEASCLNLYKPENPKVLGAKEAFLREGRFSFSDSLATTEEQKKNPWLLLLEPPINGAIPTAIDFNSMEYVLHKNLGDEIPVDGKKLRLVASLSDSIFQGELVIAETHFLQAFPASEGFRFFLLDGPPSEAAKITQVLEDSLADSGFDASPTEDKLARFHAVENTYLSTFQMLGMLGLLLGTVGLSAVLLRNVLERRRELALLKAVGYSPKQLGWVVLAENGLLLVMGLAIGLAAALLAVAPMFKANSGSIFSMLSLLLLVLAAGLASAFLAMRAAIRSPLLAGLRSE